MPSDEDITEFIVAQFQCLHTEYISARSLIPVGNLVELSFDTLTGRGATAKGGTVNTILNIYKQFGWDHEEAGGGGTTVSGQPVDNVCAVELARVEEKLRRYCAGLRAYTKNDHKPLPRGIREMLVERWADHFNEFGYDTSLVD